MGELYITDAAQILQRELCKLYIVIELDWIICDDSYNFIAIVMVYTCDHSFIT